jgi:molybdopterin/thiamine biosynthesis adenylyltransferase
MNERIQITSGETTAASDDRFQRFSLIGWWDQKRLTQAKILVVGAGALGNEIVKNLALLGIGNILIADLDLIENSNLSRSVLYRECDSGKSKAEIAAAAAKAIYPGMNVHYFHGDVIHDLGLGAFRWADVVLGGLDNREARLTINRHCWKVNRPWIDGAIEQIQGCARVFVPEGPCYECTMSAIDWELLQRRRSCNLLTREEMQGGRTPTTPTISSIIAGVQCQEAVKLLHGLPTIAGKGWIFEGMGTEAYQVEYQQKDDCYSHETLDEIISLPHASETLTVRELLNIARERLGQDTRIEIVRDMIERLICPQCGTEEPLFTSLGRIRSDRAFCPNCPGIRRNVVTFYHIRGTETFLDRTLSDLGIPKFDILVARTGDRMTGLELTADSQHVLGTLDVSEEGLEWK